MTSAFLKLKLKLAYHELEERNVQYFGPTVRGAPSLPNREGSFCSLPPPTPTPAACVEWIQARVIKCGTAASLTRGGRGPGGCRGETGPQGDRPREAWLWNQVVHPPERGAGVQAALAASQVGPRLSPSLLGPGGNTPARTRDKGRTAEPVSLTVPGSSRSSSSLARRTDGQRGRQKAVGQLTCGGS